MARKGFAVNLIYKNPYNIPPRFDAAATDALVALMQSRPDIASFTLQQARNNIPALAGKADGYVAQCLQDALTIAAAQLDAADNISKVAPVRARSWLDYIV